MRVYFPPNLKTLKLIIKLVCLECEEFTDQKFKRKGNKFRSRQVWKISAWNSVNGLPLCPLQRHRGARWGLKLGLQGLALTCRCVLVSSQNNFKFLETSCINVVWGLLCKIRSSSRNRPILLCWQQSPWAVWWLCLCDGLCAYLPQPPHFPITLPALLIMFSAWPCEGVSLSFLLQINHKHA